MASLPLISCSITPTPSLLSTQYHHFPCAHFSPKPLRFSIHAKPSSSPVSSKATNADQSQNEDSSQGDYKFDRRNMLVGMGGLYGAAASANQLAFANKEPPPPPPPDLNKCVRGTNLNKQKPLDVNCCPPVSRSIDYKLPPVYQMRYRPAAHKVTKEYIAKYKRAVQLMKDLPADDPRSFMQQANVHCAYCNLNYVETGHEDQKLQIHYCWLFFPWHRWYLYFYERILGKLIDDPNFGLPYWNWDNPPGMPIPAMFVDPGSSLFNDKRNQNHLPPKPVDLGYSRSSEDKPPDKVISDNLGIVFRDLVRNATTLEDFYGQPYFAGTPPNPGAGTVDRGCHTAAHVWVGDPRQPSQEDMGNLYSAGREPLFFSHHVNVDRLWSIWREKIRAPKHTFFQHPSWLNTTFLFYDENKQLVSVKVSDTLDTRKMGYFYQPMELPWLFKRPTARVRKSTLKTTSGAPPVSSTVFPIKLDKVFSVVVPRPKKSRSVQEKNEEQELLVIEGIEVDTGNFIKFDVFINDIDDLDDFDKAEYAGTFSQIPHKNSTKVKTSMRLALNELLEDLDVEGDDEILVTLASKDGGDDISIGGIKIIYTS